MEHDNDLMHHSDTPASQTKFIDHVSHFVNIMTSDNFGNPFEAGNSELISLYTKKVADAAVCDSVRKAKLIGQSQYDQ